MASPPPGAATNLNDVNGRNVNATATEGATPVPAAASSAARNSWRRPNQHAPRQAQPQKQPPRGGRGGGPPQLQPQPSQQHQQQQQPPRAAPVMRQTSAEPTSPHTGHLPRHVAMAEQLRSGTYECMICTDAIVPGRATWACSACYRVYDLVCVKKWAKSEGSGEGRSFRCPACQCQYDALPNKYVCFCGARRDPKPDGFLTPHSCGDTCNRQRGLGCPHRCTLQCHPGPCPDCTQAAPPKRCPCGRTEYIYPCGKPDPRTTCENVCGKRLGCGKHTCEMPCHHGPCAPCVETVTVACRCGKTLKEGAPCGSPAFGCDTPCGKPQRCGAHTCTTVCHEGSCPPCDTDPAVVCTCPCGKTPLTKTRAKCTDPVPTCENICGRVLLCGRHECLRVCHTGPCAPCDVRENTFCRCGCTQRKLSCAEATAFHCDRKCKARLSCGKHECSTLCCPHRRSADASVHPCLRVCGKKLPCGHACPDPCHRGVCPPCVNIVTHELSCACGHVVIEPPQPCGTQPPECRRPCERDLPCGHESVQHNCHFGDCPPCTAKVARECVGGHKVLSGVMCSAGPTSCGKTCDKPLPGCGHGCPRMCHAGPCVENADKPRKCTQACGKPLPCGHTCRAKCHADRPTAECPPCTSTEEVPCECGLSMIKLSCAEYSALAAQLTASGAAVVAPCSKNCDYQRRLSALDELRHVDPNADGAAGAGDRFGGLAPSRGAGHNKVNGSIYTFHLWEAATHGGLDAVVAAERHIAAFVRSQESQAVLPVMTRERRALVHELAPFFLVDAESVDREPKRSVCLTRHMYSRIPAKLVSEAINDPTLNPETVARTVFAHRAAATKCVIVFEGLPDVLTEVTVFRTLRFHMGLFTIVDKATAPSVFPDGLVPGPLQPHRGDESVFLLAVFAKGHDAAAAFSAVRKSGCVCTFHWFGEAPPPTNFTAREMGAKGQGPVQARWFCDEATTTVAPGSGAQKPRVSVATVAAAGAASWANVARRETARQKEASRKDTVETGNKFAALGRK